MDYLSRLESNNQDFFNWLNMLWSVPDIDPDWDLWISEPTDEELELMDQCAAELLLELESEDE